MKGEGKMKNAECRMMRRGRWSSAATSRAVLLLLSAFCILHSSFAQTALDAPGLAAFASAPVAGGGGGACTPSYTGGTGDRTASITVTAPNGLFNNAAGPQNLVKGDLTGHYWFNGHTLDGSTYWIKFYFNGVPTLVTEWKWYQDTSTTQGVWQWYGSNDDSSYTALGSSFTLGGVTPVSGIATQTITAMSGNTTKYLYYKLIGISGTTSSLPFQLNVEDKFCQ
jgi:hypothetical protein